MNVETYHAFVIFARENPELYDQLVAKLREMKALGFHFYSVKTCWDVIRFEFDKIHGPNDSYKLNDRYQSLYSRLIYAREEDLRGFYETRVRQDSELSDLEVYARLDDDFQTGYLVDAPVDEPTMAELQPQPLELLPPKKTPVVDPDHREYTDEDIANAL